MFKFIGKILSLPFSVLAYFLRHIPIINRLVPKKQPKIDFSSNKVLFVPRFFVDKKTVLKAFRDIFGQDCENLMHNDRILFTNEKYEDLSSSYHSHRFENEKDFFEKLEKFSPEMNYMTSSIFKSFCCIINDENLYKMKKHNKVFIISDIYELTDQAKIHALNINNQRVTRTVFADTMNAANQDIRCACGADLSKNLDEDFEECQACDRNIEEALSDEALNLIPEMKKKIEKERKDFCKKIGVNYNEVA